MSLKMEEAKRTGEKGGKEKNYKRKKGRKLRKMFLKKSKKNPIWGQNTKKTIILY